MRRDCRGPSSSSTMRSVGFVLGAGAALIGCSEIVSKRKRDCVCLEAIAAIGQRTLRDIAARAVGILIGEIPVEMLKFLADANAEDVSVRVWNRRVEAVVWHGVFAVNVSRAG